MSWDEAQLDSIAAIGKISDPVTPRLARLLRKVFFWCFAKFCGGEQASFVAFFWRSEAKKTP